jgi:16S rRNA G966 N2-methylase RsmD
MSPAARKPSSLLDTRVIYCGDNLDQLAKLPANCIDLIYIDPPFNSNRNYEVFWGETKEKRSFEDRHASTQAYIPHSRAWAPAPHDPIQLLKSQNGREKFASGFDGALLLSLHSRL